MTERVLIFATQLYEAALPLACVAGSETNHCASCGRWGGNDFDGRDDHADDCDLYAALVAYRQTAAVDVAGARRCGCCGSVRERVSIKP